jgi:hypothetical protein
MLQEGLSTMTIFFLKSCTYLIRYDLFMKKMLPSNTAHAMCPKTNNTEWYNTYRNTELPHAILSHILHKRETSKVACFSKICPHASFQDLILSGAFLAPTSEVHVSIMLVLLSARKLKITSMA